MLTCKSRSHSHDRVSQCAQRLYVILIDLHVQMQRDIVPHSTKIACSHYSELFPIDATSRANLSGGAVQVHLGHTMAKHATVYISHYPRID